MQRLVDVFLDTVTVLERRKESIRVWRCPPPRQQDPSVRLLQSQECLHQGRPYGLSPVPGQKRYKLERDNAEEVQPRQNLHLVETTSRRQGGAHSLQGLDVYPI